MFMYVSSIFPSKKTNLRFDDFEYRSLDRLLCLFGLLLCEWLRFLDRDLDLRFLCLLLCLCLVDDRLLLLDLPISIK